jgi:DNA polymerase III delta subunit
MLESRLAPTLITFACLDLARKLHAATEAHAAGHSPQQTAGALKLWGPSKDAVLSAARRLSRPRASQLLSEALAADAAQKSGLGDPIRSIERLVLRFPSLLHPDADRRDRSSPNRI